MKSSWHWLAVAVIVTAAVPAVLLLRVSVDPFSAEVGFAGDSFAPAAAPTGDKPQSKLWFHDGRWWGLLLRARTTDLEIHTLDQETQRWDPTGVLVDKRARAHADALAIDDDLFVISMGSDPDDVAHGALFSRYSYDPEDSTYTRDESFPQPVTVFGAESIVMTRDSNGLFWVVFVRHGEVLTSHSDDGGTWSVPQALPVPLAKNVSLDDIASIVSFEDRKRPAVGVLFSNQTEGAFVFAVHLDNKPPDEWNDEVILQGPKIADDHLNLKVFSDRKGSHIFAAVKTSLTAPTDPLLLLLHRTPDAEWETSTIGTVEDNQTRPTLAIDGDHRQVHVFSSAPCCSGGFIYRKTTNIDAVSFEPGIGEVVIAVEPGSRLNNPTTTKQTLGGETGMVVVASDVARQTYAHTSIPLDSRSIDLDALITDGPSGLVEETSAVVEFSATSPTATFECRMAQGQVTAFQPCTSPASFTDLSAGPHRFEVRALDPTHPDVIDTAPATRSWHVISESFADAFTDGFRPEWRIENRGDAGAEPTADGDRGEIIRFSSTATPRTFVTASLPIETTSALTLALSVNVEQEGVGEGHVRLATLVGLEGAPAAYLYRQNGSGRVWLQIGATRLRTTASLPLGSWADVELHILGLPSQLTAITVLVDDRLVLDEETGELAVPTISGLELGYRTTAQRYALLVDAVSVGI